MKTLYTANDLETMLANGESLDSIPANAKFTPMARDILRKQGIKPGGVKAADAQVRIHEPVLPNYEYHWTPGSDPKTPEALQKFFYSPEIQAIKQRMCDIGKRIWNNSYVDGNGGNITVRVGDNLVLCTPTLISKGFMTADDICMVDMNGDQVAGTRPRTSEVNTHIGIMKNEPSAKSCVHAHPVYATAFAVAGVVPPPCLIPEPEVFLGEIGLAEYQTPGSPENAATVGALAKRHQSIIMQNHGVIVWGKDVEDAYWKMENTEAFCKTVWVSQQIGDGPKPYSGDKLKELIEIRKKLGMPDFRGSLKECELCDSGDFQVNKTCTLPQPSNSDCGCNEVDQSLDDMVKVVTDMILEELKKQ